MSPVQPAALSSLARHSGETHTPYSSRLRRWFGWCQTNGHDALVGIQHAHVEFYVHHLGECGLMASSVCTSRHAVPIEDFAETLCGLVGKGNKPATMPITVRVLRVLEACRGERTNGPLILRPNSGNPIDRHGVHFLTAYVAGA